MKDSKTNERNGPPLSVTRVIGTISPVSGSVRYSMSDCPSGSSRSASASASSTASIASCLFAVGDQCHPNSYFDQ